MAHADLGQSRGGLGCGKHRLETGRPVQTSGSMFGHRTQRSGASGLQATRPRRRSGADQQTEVEGGAPTAVVDSTRSGLGKNNRQQHTGVEEGGSRREAARRRREAVVNRRQSVLLSRVAKK
jgi:hypothetical protein